MQIEGYENYLIYEDGRIYNTKLNKFMTPHLYDGYLKIRLSNKGKRKTFRIHRLLAKAFIPNPDNKPCVDHINRIRNDNRLENLRWCTIKENGHNKKILKNNTSGATGIVKKYRKSCNQGFTWEFYVFNYGQKKFIKSSVDKDYLVKFAEQWKKENNYYF